MKPTLLAASILCLCVFAGMASGQPKQKTPEQVAQALIDAFNAHDVEGILKTYSTDSVAYQLPGGESILKGHVDIRKKFATAFERDHKVKVEIVQRIVDGKFVIDKEKITGMRDGKPYEFFGTIIYEITDGLIRKEWYLRNE